MYKVFLRSYASRSQLAVTPEERQRSVELEWERRLLTVIGVANRRKYEFRLQSDRNTSAEDLVQHPLLTLLLTLSHSRRRFSSWQTHSDASKWRSLPLEVTSGGQWY